MEEATKFEYINKIIENVKNYRLNSTRSATQKLSKVSHRFGEVRYKGGDAIIVPGLSAEKRVYIPLGFITDDTIVTNLAQVIYDASPWLFGIISSKINNIWVRKTSGFFKKDVRYSPLLSYNTLPVPNLTNQQKDSIALHTFNILEERERHSEKTIEQLYHHDKMPDGLREAHHHLDLAVERCYRSKPFTSDEERLEYLFKLYESMTNKESAG